jgi:hypothetical protein
MAVTASPSFSLSAASLVLIELPSMPGTGPDGDAYDTLAPRRQPAAGE